MVDIILMMRDQKYLKLCLKRILDTLKILLTINLALEKSNLF